MRTYLTIAALAALTGCVHHAWFKDGATEQDFIQARARCNMGVANTPVGVNGFDSMARQSSYFNNCMVADGWSLRRR